MAITINNIKIYLASLPVYEGIATLINFFILSKNTESTLPVVFSYLTVDPLSSPILPLSPHEDAYKSDKTAQIPII